MKIFGIDSFTITHLDISNNKINGTLNIDRVMNYFPNLISIEMNYNNMRCFKADQSYPSVQRIVISQEGLEMTKENTAEQLQKIFPCLTKLFILKEHT